MAMWLCRPWTQPTRDRASKFGWIARFPLIEFFYECRVPSYMFERLWLIGWVHVAPLWCLFTPMEWLALPANV